MSPGNVAMNQPNVVWPHTALNQVQEFLPLLCPKALLKFGEAYELFLRVGIIFLNRSNTEGYKENQ